MPLGGVDPPPRKPNAPLGVVGGGQIFLRAFGATEKHHFSIKILLKLQGRSQILWSVKWVSVRAGRRGENFEGLSDTLNTTAALQAATACLPGAPRATTGRCARAAARVPPRADGPAYPPRADGPASTPVNHRQFTNLNHTVYIIKNARAPIHVLVRASVTHGLK